MLARCSYQKEDRLEKDKKGIKRLLNNGTYTAAFPLHDVRHWQYMYLCYTCISALCTIYTIWA